MVCILWSPLVLYPTCASWKTAQILSTISLEVCELIPDSSHVFLKIEQEAVLYIGISQWFHPRAAQLLAGTSLCHSKSSHRPQWTLFAIALCRALHSGHSESKGSLWAGEMPWQPWYLIPWHFLWGLIQPHWELGLARTNSSLWLEFSIWEDAQELNLEIRQCLLVWISLKPQKQRVDGSCFP